MVVDTRIDLCRNDAADGMGRFITLQEKAVREKKDKDPAGQAAKPMAQSRLCRCEELSQLFFSFLLGPSNVEHIRIG
jgi:hypothetical protein